MAQHYERTRTDLGQSLSPSERWSKLKSAVFEPDSNTSPLIGERGSLICEHKAKAEALSRFFDGKQ